MPLVDTHVHTCHSYDGYLSLSKLDRACEYRRIDVVAITDHNVISGAVEASRLNKSAILKTRIIVGEEIETSEGEIIGLFLKEKIWPRMSLAETTKAIHNQGGLVYLNHPFGYGRRSAKLSFEALEPLWDEVDIIEIFNGRNWERRANILAKQLASIHNKPGAVGTDAHSEWEVGRSFVRMADFDGPATFLTALRDCSYVCRPCPIIYRIFFKARKMLLPRPNPTKQF